MNRPVRVLFLDDRLEDGALVQAALEAERGCFEVQPVTSEEELKAFLAVETYDLLLCEWEGAGFAGPQVIEQVRSNRSTLPVFVLISQKSPEIASLAVQQGAAGYVIKDEAGLERLPAALQAVLNGPDQQHPDEFFFGNLVEGMAEGIVALDLDGLVVYINPAVEGFLGLSKDLILGQHWTKFIPEEQHGRVREADERREKGDTDQYELDLIRQDGKNITFQVTGRPRVNDGRFVGTLGVFTDIAARKQMEAALRTSEERYSILFHQSLDVVILHDLEGQILDVNQQTQGKLGFARAELLTLRMQELLKAGEERYEQIFGPLRENGHIQAEIDIIRNDGGVLPGEIFASGVEIAGRFCVQSVVRDRSESLKVEESLHRRAQQQAEILESARDLTGSLEFMEVLTRIGERSKDLLKAYGCAIYMLEEDGATLTPVVSLEPPYDEEILAMPLQVDTSFTGLAVKARRPLYFNEVVDNDQGQQIPGTPQDEDERVLVAPFIVEGTVLGAMCLNRQGTYFTDEDLTLAETFAAYASTALKNVRTYQELQREVDERKRAELETQQRNRELTLLNRVIMEVSSNPDPQAVLAVTCRELSLVFGGVRSYAGLLNESHAGLKVIAEYPLRNRQSMLGLFLPLAENLAAQHVLSSRAPLAISNVDESPYLEQSVRTFLGDGIMSILTLPLNVRGEIVGVVALFFEMPRSYSEEEISLAMNAATAAAQVIEMARLFEQTRRRAEELEALTEVSQAMRTAPGRAEMYPAILNQLLYMLEAEGASLAWRDSVNGDTVIQLAHGRIASRTGLRLAPGEGVTGEVIATGKPIVSEALGSGEGLDYPDLLDDLYAVASVPLIARKKALGALMVLRPEPFTDDEVNLLIAIGDLAASAIHQAGLHEQTERRLQRLTALRTIDEAISASLDLRITLNVFLRQVTDQLNVDAAAVLLLDPHLGMLVYAAGQGFRTEAITHSRLRLGEGRAGQAALERRIVQVLDLSDPDSSFSRSVLLRDESFVAYYGVPLIAKGQVQGVLDIYHRTALQPDPDWTDFLDTLATQAAIAIDNAKLFNDLQRSNVELALAYDTTIEGWARALELRDMETEGHSQRVTELTLELARQQGMRDEELVHIRHGALLHDIGKMGVPDSILHKPGPLTDEEWAIMHQHPVYAYKLLNPIAYLRPAVDIPYCHHEKWDGSGYPRGLKGEQIPLSARVFAVVDVWDALCSDRPYRPAWSQEKALAYIKDESGRHFDPHVVEAFLALLQL
jgi:PAS domain S-box-containing protein